MLLHSISADVNQEDVKRVAAKAIISALASHFNVTEKRMTTALKNLLHARKTEIDENGEPVDFGRIFSTDPDGYREIEDTRVRRRQATDDFF